jgi:hypothetical protein
MRNDVIASIGQTVLTALAIKYSLSLIVLPVWCAVVELSGGRTHRETVQRLAVSMAGPITWTVIPAGVFGTLLTCAPSVIDFLLRHNDGRVIGTALGFLWWIIRPQRYQTLEIAGFYWLIEIMFPSIYPERDCVIQSRFDHSRAFSINRGRYGTEGGTNSTEPIIHSMPKPFA